MLDRLHIALEEMLAGIHDRWVDKRFPDSVLDKMEKDAIIQNYSPPKIFLEKSRGSFLIGRDGKCWADFQGAYSANNPGNRNVRITAVAHVAERQSSVMARSRRHPELALAGHEIQRIFGPDHQILPMNTGCEAIEGSVALAKLVFNRHERFKEKREALKAEGKIPKIVFCKNNFHGRSLWAKAASSEPPYRDPFAPNTMEQEMEWVNFGNLEELETALKKGDVSAFVTEPIQGEGGIFIPPKGYLKQVRELCDKYNTLLVIDEVQTGLGRTGKMLAQSHDGIEADMIAMGKSLSGGLQPISTILTRKEYGTLMKPGEHGSTFGGSGVACAIMRASLREIEDRELCKASEENGEFLLEKLKELCADIPSVIEVRGLGLMIGVEIKSEAEAVCEKLRHSHFKFRGKKIEGLWTNSAHEKVIRISPPLTISRDLLEASVYAFAQALGHPDPEKFRNKKLEGGESLAKEFQNLNQALKYLGRRWKRFKEDMAEAKKLR